MARKPIPRNLPPVSRLRQNFPGFEHQKSKRTTLVDHLRKAARRLQKKEARAFYTMREIAVEFQLPLRTVALAYKTLEHEGLLNRRRSSHTLLVGKKLAPNKPVRAVVGVPVWLHAMVTAPYSRIFHIELEERLRQHGFVADFIFFRGADEPSKPDFAQRLIEHNLDYVLWHTPHPHSGETLRALSDHGVRQVLVQPIESQLGVELPTYLQDWQGAYRTLAQSWHDAGVRHVVVSEPVYLPSRRARTGFRTTLEKYGLDVSFSEGNAAELLQQITRFKAGTAALAFIDQEGAEAICSEEPAVIERILKRARVGFCRGPIRLPYFNHREASIDMVCFSPVETAGRIVADLNETMRVEQGVLHTFQAQYLAGIPFKTNIELL